MATRWPSPLPQGCGCSVCVPDWAEYAVGAQTWTRTMNGPGHPGDPLPTGQCQLALISFNCVCQTQMHFNANNARQERDPGRGNCAGTVRGFLSTTVGRDGAHFGQHFHANKAIKVPPHSRKINESRWDCYRTTESSNYGEGIVIKWEYFQLITVRTDYYLIVVFYYNYSRVANYIWYIFICSCNKSRGFSLSMSSYYKTEKIFYYFIYNL